VINTKSSQLYSAILSLQLRKQLTACFLDVVGKEFHAKFYQVARLKKEAISTSKRLANRHFTLKISHLRINLFEMIA